MPRPNAEDQIPADVLAAARRGGLEDPLWYVGRRTGERPEVDRTLDDLVREAEARAREGKTPEPLDTEEGKR